MNFLFIVSPQQRICYRIPMEDFFAELNGVLGRLPTDLTALDDYAVSEETVRLFIADYCTLHNISQHSVTNIQGNCCGPPLKNIKLQYSCGQNTQKIFKFGTTNGTHPILCNFLFTSTFILVILKMCECVWFSDRAGFTKNFFYIVTKYNATTRNTLRLLLHAKIRKNVFP